MAPKLPQHVQSRAGAINIACITFPMITSVFVVMRIWTRVMITHNLGWDDYVATNSLLLCSSVQVSVSPVEFLQNMEWDFIYGM